MNQNSDLFQYSIVWKDRDKHSDMHFFVASIAFVINELKTLSPSYSRWFHVGSSRKDSLERELNLNDLEAEVMLCSPKFRKQPEFGLTFSIWNGEIEDRDVKLSFRGLSHSPKMDDFFSLGLPYDLTALSNRALITGDASVFKKIAQLAPTYALLTSAHLMDQWLELGIPGLPVGYRTMARIEDAYFKRLSSMATECAFDGYTLFDIANDPGALSLDDKSRIANTVFNLGFMNA